MKLWSKCIWKTFYLVGEMTSGSLKFFNFQKVGSLPREIIFWIKY